MKLFLCHSLSHKLPRVSINCTRVKISLMLFMISKVPFLTHFFGLYLMWYWPLWRNFPFIIALANLITFLNLFDCNFNDSSMIFARVVAALFRPILWKSDAILLKQKILDDFWRYFITGASRQNTIVSIFLHYLLGLSILAIF